MCKLITVFTPTYNRYNTLIRVYESLLHQNYDLFDWLIVDDGSVDGTYGLISELEKQSPFQIEYFYQENGGKHRAHNTALGLSNSELLLILDSDDELCPGAIETISNKWLSTPINLRGKYAGLIGNCIDEDGLIVGELFPYNIESGYLFSLYHDGFMTGEKLPCYRIDILKMYPFPTLHGNNELVPEGVIWMQIGRKYKVHCINNALRIYHRDYDDSLSLINKSSPPSSAAWGKMVYNITILNLIDNNLLKFFYSYLSSAINVTRYGLHSMPVVVNQLDELKNKYAKLLWLILFPVGLFYWIYDKYCERK